MLNENSAYENNNHKEFHVFFFLWNKLKPQVPASGDMEHFKREENGKIKEGFHAAHVVGCVE